MRFPDILKTIVSFLLLTCCFSCGEDPKPSGSATPTTGIAANITSNSASLAVDLSIAGSVTIDSKGICWSLNQSPTTSDTKTNEGPGPGSFTSQLSGLTPNSTYYVRSYVMGGGKTTYGNEVSFTTLKSFTLTLTTSVATQVTGTTAVSGGSMVATGTGTVTAKGVCWSKSENPTIADSKTTNGTGTSSFTSSLANLTASTKYYVRAYATDGNNATTYGNQISFTTEAPLVITVQTTAVSAVAVTSATSGGTVAITGTGTITSRGVCWSTTTNPTIANTKASSGSGVGTFSTNLTGLTANTQYYARAYATDNSGNTVYGNEISFKTADLSLDGLWQVAGSSNVLKISGTSTTWETPYTPGTVYQAAIDQGFMTLSTAEMKNIAKTGNTTWTCQIWKVSYTSITTTVTKAAYVNATITMASSGASFTVSGTVPAGVGWPAALVGTNFSTTYGKK